MRYILENDNLEIVGKQYLKDVGGYDGTNADSCKDIANVFPNMVELTYSELKTLRDSSNLVSGQQYRITDYITTTTQENTISAGHQFDIIVIADTVNILNENARACLHDGDTYFSNAGANLEAWQIWYCLDNDKDRFAWADTNNGKGVIYRMIDAWGNDLPYDFKNIKFKRWLYADCGGITDEENGDFESYCYTFSWEESNGDIIDASIFGNNGHLLNDEYQISGVYGNIMCAHMDYGDYVENPKSTKQWLNNNVFFSTYGYDIFYSGCQSNTFGNECYDNTLGNKCYSNTFGDRCSNNILGNSCYSNKFGDNCNSNTFGTNCYYNTFCNSFGFNTFGNECYDNTFGNYCFQNTFGNHCYFNTFGNRCQSNTFGNECYSNTLGDSCNFNKFGDYCDSNTFGINCQSNTFDDDCCYNTFGDDCLSNKFDTNCSFNKFGYSCTSNTFGDSCYSNTFDNYCYSNTFGYSCYGNTFGNNCNCNTFGSSKSSPSSYYRYIIFDNANCYINLNCTSTTSSSNFYQNVRIGLGVNNNTTTYKTIDDANTNQTFETLYISENSQTIKI